MEKRPFWVMKQIWEDLLFLHWDLDPEEVKPLIPPELKLDLYEGKAWITVLPFKVSYQRFHGLPEIPFLQSFLELNVRTYVTYKDMPGVYFFSLDADHPLFVTGAKAASLPYRLAKMDMVKIKNQTNFMSKRIFKKAEFGITFEPSNTPFRPVEDSLDYWLLERYCLFTKWGNWIFRGTIQHERWQVSGANVHLEVNTVTPLRLPNEPTLSHYSTRKDTFIFPLKRG